MKKSLRISGVFILFLTIFLTHSCQKDKLAPPVIITTEVTAITSTSANSGGDVTNEGGDPVKSRGICWNTSAEPTIDHSKTTDTGSLGLFSSKITQLTPNTLYYVRAYATNSAGTGYGNQVSFITNQTVTDINSNVYETVNIGTQTWMAENLKTNKYKDGTAIPFVTSGASWIYFTTPAFCWYNNDANTYKDTYGALYNWYAINTGKLCPTGWHVPTDIEWATLTTFLGGESVAGGKLKETGTTHWISPNTGATNETGFAALPGGYRDNNGTFDGISSNGFWWSSSESYTGHAWYRTMSYSYNKVYRSNYCLQQYGLSVRCLKDN